MKHIKCLVVGDTNKDRIAFLLAYTTGSHPGEYIPTVFDRYSQTLVIEDQDVDLQLCNMESDDNPRLRPLNYPLTDVLVICFSLVSPSSLEDIQKKWLPEIMEHCPNIPYILVGLKSEIRDSFEDQAEEYRSNGWEPVPTAKGEEAKKAIGARAYIECSARRQYNLKEVFETAVKVALHPAEPEQEQNLEKKKHCQIA